MAKPILALDDIRVATPCPASWDEMKGTDQVRHCGGCRMNVYNLSAMTRKQAETLVAKTEGRLCVRFYRREDGTLLTQDCPVGLRALRRKMARLGGALAAMFLGLLAAGCGTKKPDPVPTTGKPAMPGTTGLAAPINPPEMGGPRAVMGDSTSPEPLQGEACPPTPK